MTRAEIDNALEQAYANRSYALHTMRDWMAVLQCEAAIIKYTQMQEASCENE